MSDNLSIFVTMIVLVILIVIFPLYNHFERQDNMSYNLVLKATTNFIDEVINCGYIDQEMYTRYVSQIANTGNLYDIQLEAHKKIITTNPENSDEYQDQYIVDYNDDIFDENTGKATEGRINNETIKNDIYKLDIGDQIYIKVKNSSTTMAEAMFRNIVPTATEKNITVNYGGIIKNNAWLKADDSIVAKKLVELKFKVGGLIKETYKEYLYHGDTDVKFTIAVEDPAVDTGYTFLGWRDVSNTTSNIYKKDDEIVLKDSITLEPVLETSTPTVTFKSNAVGIPNSTKKVTYGEKYGVLPAPTRTGYKFDGWYTEAGKKITEIDIVGTATDHELYAHWTIAEYSIIYKNVEGANNNNPSNYKYDEIITLSNPTKSGYVFDGWYTDSTFTTKITTITGTGNKEVHAKWVKEITVSLDSNGGSDASPKTIKFAEGTKYYPTLNSITNPTRENCSFDGWYTSLSGGTKITSDSIVSGGLSHHTLYAHWKPNTGYKITKHNFQGKNYYIMREYYGSMVNELNNEKVETNTVYPFMIEEIKNGKIYYKIGNNRYILKEAFE